MAQHSPRHLEHYWYQCIPGHYRYWCIPGHYRYWCIPVQYLTSLQFITAYYWLVTKIMTCYYGHYKWSLTFDKLIWNLRLLQVTNIHWLVTNCYSLSDKLLLTCCKDHYKFLISSFQTCSEFWELNYKWIFPSSNKPHYKFITTHSWFDWLIINYYWLHCKKWLTHYKHQDQWVLTSLQHLLTVGNFILTIVTTKILCLMVRQYRSKAVLCIASKSQNMPFASYAKI